MPADAEFVRLVSRSGHCGDDRRRLGALVKGFRIDAEDITMQDVRFASGFHQVEVHGVQTVRWTNGRATIAIGRAANDRVIEIDIAAVIAEKAEQLVA